MIVRADLPSGTVTFLFTDIEGSTKLLHELGPEGFAGALAEHRRLLRDAFNGRGGVEVDTQGDAFFYAFPDAAAAVEAARAGREALAAGPIRVRVGIHTGAPHVTDEGYIGPDVHLGARIGAAGHGGQVLLSKETFDLVDVDVLDLGEHRLKDFEQPVWIYQLGTEAFPPLKTISNTNLPRPASSFVGRARERDEVVALLQNGARLVTLTGPGGTGKTRLSIETATELLPENRNGVFWIGLSSLRDPALVQATISQVLGAQDGLADHISNKEMLLVLDNFEQIVSAAPELPHLLFQCPNLRLLVTSRELLRVQGEVEYAVPPLAHTEAVELFCERSGLVPDAVISELCSRLDDLPLAVELAAARTNALSAARILERLSTTLDTLKGGRDADPRQATLRATIEWSYDLLSDEEKELFARLAVFRGGCMLETAEEVVDADLDTMLSLVDKSLMRHRSDRYWMLETIREFAAERLDERVDAEETRQRHFDHFLSFAEKAYTEHFSSSSRWFDITDAEHDNIRSALDWAAERDRGAEARLAGAIAPYWVDRGFGLEARDRLTAIHRTYEVPGPIRARVCKELGTAIAMLGDDAEGVPYLADAVEMWRAEGDVLEEAEALEILGYAYIGLGDVDAARPVFQESLALRRQVDAPDLVIAQSMAGLCQQLVASNDIERAEPLATELLEIGTRHDVARLKRWGLHYLADCSLIAGDYEEAERRYLRALAHSRESGLLTACTEELLGVAMSLAGRGHHERAVLLAAASYARKEVLGTYGTSAFWTVLQERHIGGAREGLGPERSAEAERAGRSTAFDSVLDEILGMQAVKQ
jgi:predicted ATPase